MGGYKFQSGAVMVEFAIIAPFFLLLFLGIIEFSWAFYHLNTLNKSVRDGARYFSDYTVARYESSVNGYSLDYPINTSTSSNSANINNLQTIVKNGYVASSTLLLPDAYQSIAVYCDEEDKSNTVCQSSTEHIRVTATYNHNFILGNVLNAFSGLGLSNPFPLTASVVMRVQ